MLVVIAQSREGSLGFLSSPPPTQHPKQPLPLPPHQRNFYTLLFCVCMYVCVCVCVCVQVIRCVKVMLKELEFSSDNVGECLKSFVRFYFTSRYL